MPRTQPVIGAYAALCCNSAGVILQVFCFREWKPISIRNQLIIAVLFFGIVRSVILCGAYFLWVKRQCGPIAIIAAG